MGKHNLPVKFTSQGKFLLFLKEPRDVKGGA